MSNNKYKILIADTDIKARKELSELLESNGYKVITAATAAEAVLMFKSYTPDIIISEFFLPDANGIFLIEKIKKESGVPIIILSDNGEEYNKVAALDAGADDYLTKPFAIEELLARIRVALKKRGSVEVHTHKIEIHGVSMDTDRHEVTVNGEIVELTNREFELLRTLMENKDIVMDREKLLSAVCGYDYLGETNIIDVYVRYLRTKIDDRFGVKLITTVRGVGYVIRE